MKLKLYCLLPALIVSLLLLQSTPCQAKAKADADSDDAQDSYSSVEPAAADNSDGDDDDEKQQSPGTINFKVYLDVTSLSSEFFKNVRERRDEYFTNLTTGGKSDESRPLEFSIGGGVKYTLPAGWFVGATAQAGYMHSSDSKLVSSDLSRALSSVFLTPFSQVSVTGATTLTSIMPQISGGYNFQIVPSMTLSPLARLGYGVGWFSENWKIDVLTSTTDDKEIEYTATAGMLDLSTGVEFTYERYLFMALLGYRKFSGGVLEQRVTRGTGLPNVVNKSADLDGSYLSFAFGMTF